jgi:hypothetical protein
MTSYEMRCLLGFGEGSEILRDWSPRAPIAQDFGALPKAQQASHSKALHDIADEHIDCYAWHLCGCNVMKSYEMRCLLGYGEGSEIQRDWSPRAPIAQDFGALAKA